MRLEIKAGGATAGMYKSSSSGWTEVDLGEALDFDGTTTVESLPLEIQEPQQL